MKLYILRPKPTLTDSDNPWNPCYDKCFGMVIRASSEIEARQLATEDGGNEIGSDFIKNEGNKEAWLSSHYSSCSELTSDGDAEIIMIEFCAT